MDSSYILLSAIGIFILIGGAKRVLRALKITSIGAVIAIIAIIIGNIFNPIGLENKIYLGTLMIIILSLVFIFTEQYRNMIGILASIVIITLVLIIYNTQIIERFNVSATVSNVMIVAGCSIGSFILSRNSGQAFVIAVLSIIAYYISIQLINNQPIIIGEGNTFEIMIYSATAAILINETVNEFISMINDRAPDLRFEAGEIEEDEDKRVSK